MENSSNSIFIIRNINLLNSINKITIDLNSEHQQTVLTNEFLSDLLICPLSTPSTSSLTSLSTLLSDTTTPTQIVVDGTLFIGVKTNMLKEKYQDQIPEDLFDRKHHQYYYQHHHQNHHQYHHQYNHRHRHQHHHE
ncbi:unnamed protein product [Rotaria sordida]|uniref:Uncharacterized protein n=2 Tax=Rotaria sordida TaxID=392033 RepID=A0A815B6E9_9BILA|nr:unnamed protein product [Rotaria sordida]